MKLLADLVGGRENVIGYWMELDNQAIAESIAGLGYDFVVCDLQHGLLDYAGMLRTLTAIRAGGAEALVRVEHNEPAAIGRPLDAGAAGVIVPLVNTAEEAAAAVAAAKYPPVGVRSFGPMRGSLYYGPDLREADAQTCVIVQIETAQGLQNVAEICRTPGLSGIYVGPVDLSISLGLAVTATNGSGHVSMRRSPPLPRRRPRHTSVRESIPLPGRRQSSVFQRVIRLRQWHRTCIT